MKELDPLFGVTQKFFPSFLRHCSTRCIYNFVLQWPIMNTIGKVSKTAESKVNKTLIDFMFDNVKCSSILNTKNEKLRPTQHISDLTDNC